MEKEELVNLMQLVINMKQNYIELENSLREKDYEKYKKIKGNLLLLQRKIDSSI